jgi:hypothetical protein
VLDVFGLQRGVVGKLLVVTVVVLAIGAGGSFALADAVGVSIPQLSINMPVPPEKAPGLERLVSVAATDSSAKAAPALPSRSDPIPGRMLGPDVPVPVAPSILRPRNGWIVSDGKSLVAVYAGTAGEDSSVGRIVIVRQDLVAGKQTVSAVDTGPTGALTIAHAPLLGSIETSAQTGTIHLRTAGGRALTLDLGSGKVGG